MTMIASDANNPEFVGAHNPDSKLTVLFYSRAVQNTFQTEQQGRPIFDDVDFVKIHLPGDKNNIVDVPAREDHKARFPLHWAHYQNKRGGDQRLVGKTPISHWPRVTAAQAEELRAMQFLAVEDVAGASDSQIQRLGMIAGMSPYAFREAAQRFMQLAAGEAGVTQAEQRVKELEEQSAREKAEFNERMAEMQKQIAALAAQQQPAAAQPQVEVKPAADKKGK